MTKKFVLTCFTVALFLALNVPCRAGLATAWHIPDNATDVGTNMRSPQFELGTNTTVTVYSGVWKWDQGNGGAQLCNQTGGWLIYKGASQSVWSSNSLAFHSNSVANQYWKTNFSSAVVGTNEVIQYYLLLTFDGFGGVTNTCVYGGDSGSFTTGSPAVAAANPFTIRNRAAWIWHNNNRVLSAGLDLSRFNCAFWTKVGYIGKNASSASRWVDNGAVYYTTNGATPTGTNGVPGPNTFVASLALDHLESDPSIAGDAMWWVGTASNLPMFTPIKYKVAFRHSANNEEKFGDYNAAGNNKTFAFTNGAVGDPVLTVNGVNANYTTTHVFVNELNNDAVPLTVLFAPNQPSVTAVEVFANVNRRDRATLDANGDGIEDGIVPPNGNNIAAGNETNYFKAYTMNPDGGGQYSLVLNATKTGAYRLTARYKVSGNTNWIWYSGGSTGRRDHAVVVSPARSRDISMYELNAMNMNAAGPTESQRGTFTDLHNGPGSRGYDTVTNRFNLQYAQNLGINWLWFQPIHPPGILNRQYDPDTGQPYQPGSPYAVKNFFQINPLLSKASTREAAMAEFTNFVGAADTAGMNVMLDEPFNHTAWDAELDASGVYYFKTNAQPTDTISGAEARFYSRSDAYDQRAFSSGSIAVAPDRYEFGKWSDVADVYFGRYAALVANYSQMGNHLNEGDWFDYSINKVGGAETGVDDPNAAGDGHGHFDSITQNVWRYFADCLLYWLDKTGCPAGTPANQTYKGIDGLRADFGQGIPPQCWEYIINKVRTRKWDFVFMSESLDGGAVTYRSNRHFDILNENIVFPLKSAGSATDYRNIFESRRASYGQSLVLLNHTSHDEETYDDPFQALIRHGVCGAMDGAPMIFYGEELGVTRTFGFNHYENNMSKNIPNFKKFNSLQPIFNNRGNGVDFLWPVYAGINQARNFSPALRSSSRYFLDLNSGGAHGQIFSVAKYVTANGSPNFNDVVFAFANLDRSSIQSGTFNVNITQAGQNLFGIKPGRLYNVKNIAAYTATDPNRRNYWLWNGGTGGIAGSNVLANGIIVSLNPVPASNAGWNTAPFEPQYLKLYDVTPPPAPATVWIGTTNNYVFSNVVTFTWSPVSDAEGGVAGYHVLVGTAPGGSNVFNGMVGGTSLTVTNVFGVRLYATITAVNNAGVEGAAVASSSVALLDPAWIPVASITTPQILSWTSVSGLVYQVWSGTNLLLPFAPLGSSITGNAPVMTLTNSATSGERFFKVQLLP